MSSLVVQPYRRTTYRKLLPVPTCLIILFTIYSDAVLLYLAFPALDVSSWLCADRGLALGSFLSCYRVRLSFERNGCIVCRGCDARSVETTL